MADPIRFVVSIAFVLIGLYFVWEGVKTAMHALRSEEWKRTAGKVKHTKLDSTEFDSTPAYRAHIVYEYSVDSRSFSGERLAFGVERFYASRRRAERTLRSYPIGAQVPVWYDPWCPSQSVLEPGLSSRALLPLAFGVGFIVVGVVMLAL